MKLDMLPNEKNREDDPIFASLKTTSFDSSPTYIIEPGVQKEKMYNWFLHIQPTAFIHRI